MMRIKDRLGKPSSEELIEELQECISGIKAERDDALQKLENYSKDHEIRKIQKEFDDYVQKRRVGFCPSEEQWKKIKAWEKTHEDTFHKASAKGFPYAMKYNPYAADYVYQFNETHLGTMGTVICQKCQRKAYERSLGQEKIYDKLMKSYDANYIIGEV